MSARRRENRPTPSSGSRPLVWPALLVLAAACLVAPMRAGAQQPVYEDGQGDATIALTGDAIITRSLSVYREPAFLRLRDLLRGATAAFTNLEVLFHDYGQEMIPAEEAGGTYMRAHPRMAQELTWMGFDVVSRANNHTMDFGVAGLRSTRRAVEKAGLVHAGTGANLARARMPAYLETGGGRVALVSVASTFADHMRAGRQRKDFRGRPGLSPIRYRTVYTVPGPRLRDLRTLHDSLGLWGRSTGDTVTLRGATFVAGAGWGRTTRPHRTDLEEIVAAVEDAARQANWVIVSSHTHEGGEDRREPARFLVELAHAVVDAGADVFVAHGPHVLKGIELYRGKPIFYSLGNFIFQNETVLLQPAANYRRYGLGPTALPGEFQDTRIETMGGGFPAEERYWESVVAVPEFRDGKLREVRLHPVTLGHGLERPQRGRPMLAGPELSREIIRELRRLSAPFGTEVAYSDGVGIVRP